MAAAGGAICDSSYETSRYENDIISGNSATGSGSYGGGLYSYVGASIIKDTTLANNAAEYGAGAYIEGTSLRLIGSTVSGNVAGDSSQEGYGAGLYLYDTAFYSTNSTFARNVAVSTSSTYSEGGAVYVFEGVESFEFSTVSGNVAGSGAANFTSQYGNGGVLRNSIVSGNTSSGGSEKDCGGTGIKLVSAGGNVLGQSSCVTALTSSDRVTTNPKLAALAANGGTTETMALTSASSARRLAVGTCSSTDQRGEPRPSTVCDSGAYQFAPGVVSSISPATGHAGTKVTLTGTGFLFAKRVAFGTKSVVFNVLSPTEITVVAPAGLSGKVTVSVTTLDGVGKTASYRYPTSKIRRR